jgi:hypothetical protein
MMLCRVASASIAVLTLAMQRGLLSSNCPKVDFVSPCAGGDSVPAQEPFGKHSCGDSSVRNELLAATATEAQIFRRTHVSGNDTLPTPRIRGSRIHRRTGSRRYEKGESQLTSWTWPILTPFQTRSCTQRLAGACSDPVNPSRTCNAAFRHDKVRPRRLI